MCIADQPLDTIAAPDCSALHGFTRESLPGHSFSVRKNAEGIAWVVLEPPASSALYRRFTICRIAPCVMVMIEDEDGRRQICSAFDVEGAIACIRNALDTAVMAVAGVQPPHATLQ